MNIRNLEFLRALADEKHGAFGARLVETIQDLMQQNANLAQQVNANPVGQPPAPPAVSGLKVTGQNGHFNVAVKDDGPVFRDVHFWLEHADNPAFQNAHVVHMGQSRNTNLFLGNVKRYFRAYSSYASSPPSAPTYHGSEVAPLPVEGGGPIGGPAFTESQSSGTGQPGQLLQGPGVAPFRSTDGVPPSR